MEANRFSKHQREAGRALLQAGKVKQVLFSEGTYQVEVADPSRKEHFWPFLQLDDAGHILDCFCECAEAEKHKMCQHLAAAHQKIFNGHSTVLHVRFRDSLWNQLCVMASHRHTSDPACLKKKGDLYEGDSLTHKRLFFVQGLTPPGKKRVKEILFQRSVETEETSLKFSNLPAEEIALWKAGRPSPSLEYELSFWADLAKWMMAVQEDGGKYTITFEGEKGQLPHWIQIKFPSFVVGFYIATVNWPKIIPSLSFVHSPLPVHTSNDERIKKIVYDEKRVVFQIEKNPTIEASTLKTPSVEALDVGEWNYVPKKGFFPKRTDPIFQEEEIPSHKIGSVLERHPLTIQKYLTNAKVHLDPVPVQYEIHFDAQENFHVVCYLFKKGDLQETGSFYFGKWVYIHSKGFYPVENLLFPAVEKKILRAEMNDFINTHRAFLGGFEGFQTHVSTVESDMRFSVSKGNLHFQSLIDLTGMGEKVIDFGEWIYLKDKGFFAKRMGRVLSRIFGGMVVRSEEISSFIRGAKEELEVLKGFFSHRCPLEKSGLEIFLNEEQKIVIRPHFSYFPSYSKERVQIFGDYTYVEGEGFYEIPHEKRIPEAYVKEKIIPKSEEAYFVLYELDALEPVILSIQKELKKPKDHFIRVLRLQKKGKNNAAEWLLEAALESDIGSLDLFDVWKAVTENKRYLFSPAGLLYLKHPRFNWLKSIPKRKWLKKGTQLCLSTLEWLKLTVFETLHPPKGESLKERKTKKLIDELTTFHPDQTIDLSGFKSDLRMYQEVGVRWLFFLYVHGLSGMLCDEMGLGKTHQAMGLIAATYNAQTEKKKTLVVCPTSVIYHWEDLLKKFLPGIKVLVFYGISRTLESFQEHYDLILTSYGTLRSEQVALSKISFEIAIFDELQTAKNAQSQVHKALKKIKAFMRLGLTGTPIENRLLELKALFDVVLPEYLPQESQFKELFVNPIEKAQDEEKKAMLTKLIKPFLLRRKKAEVLLELPEKIEEIAYCALSEEQEELYKNTYIQHRNALIEELKDPEKPLPLVHVFSLLSRLKQICDHPCLITKDYDDFEKHHSGKWNYFVDLLQEIRDSGQKVVIFSQYLDMLDILGKYLKKHRIGFAEIRGSTRNRKEQLEKFREDPKCEVFLASLQAVGVGVDLVSASVVIHYDRWWNPAKENQATDRVHRIGQNRGVQVFKLVTRGTIEEHIHQMIEKKRTLTEGVLGFDDQDHIKGLDREEILRLLWLIDKDVNPET